MAEQADAKRTKGRWTVMVFMGAATMDGEAPLDLAADADIVELASVVGSTGNSNLNVFVQRHDGGDVVSRLHLGHHGDQPIEVPDDQRQLDSGAALVKFMEWSFLTAKHEPDDHSLLVLWGHAYDFAFGRRRTRNGDVDALDFAELSDKLKALQTHYEEKHKAYYKNGRKAQIDIIGFDACDVATVEMAVQLGPYAKFLLASQVAVPIPGWPYDRILERLAKPMGDHPMCPVEFGSYAVRRFCEAYKSNVPVSLSFVNLAHSERLALSVRALAKALVSSMLRGDSRNILLDVFERAQTAADRPYIDVADFCLGLARESDNEDVLEAATALGDLLASCDPPVVGRSHVASRRPLIVEHGRNCGALTRLHGISLYAPHLGSDDPADAHDQYKLFELTRDTVWGALVHAL